MAQHCRVTDVLVEEDLTRLYRNAENLTEIFYQHSILLLSSLYKNKQLSQIYFTKEPVSVGKPSLPSAD